MDALPKAVNNLIVSSPIWLSRHAIHRYRHRLRPELDFSQARRQLLSHLPRLDWTEKPPAWVALTPSSLGAVAYLVDGDSYALPLKEHRHRPGYVAPTCLTPNLTKPDYPWVDANDIEEARELIALSGARVVSPWRRRYQFATPALARADLYRRICLGRLGLAPEEEAQAYRFIWLPGGAVLALNPRPDGLRASRLFDHDCAIESDPEIIAKLKSLGKKG